MGRKHHNN